MFAGFNSRPLKYTHYRIFALENHHRSSRRQTGIMLFTRRETAPCRDHYFTHSTLSIPYRYIMTNILWEYALSNATFCGYLVNDPHEKSLNRWMLLLPSVFRCLSRGSDYENERRPNHDDYPTRTRKYYDLTFRPNHSARSCAGRVLTSPSQPSIVTCDCNRLMRPGLHSVFHTTAIYFISRSRASWKLFSCN